MEGLSSIDDHRSLIDLNGKTILFPEQKQYAPNTPHCFGGKTG
jgi:hypothetical protein